MEWKGYTTKETLKDNDELMILDTDGKANKRTLMNKVWNYVVDKLTNAVIENLHTADKTMIGAINELNSNKFTSKFNYIEADFDNYTDEGVYVTSDFYGIAHAPSSNHDSCFMFVFGSNWIIQIAFSTYTNDGIYVRRNYGEYWSDWNLARYS